MDAILHDLLNTIAPLLVQFLAALILAVVAALLLKVKAEVQGRLTAQQLKLIQDLAEVAVHFAETEGLGKAGQEKAQLARDFVDRQLQARGVTTESGSEIEAAIVGAVQRAWAYGIGPTDRAQPTSPSAAQPPEPAAVGG